MGDLKNLYHNFPLLAKQSGYYFQLHRGRVNWSEIEKLDINEIIEKRNFDLLEQNLVNVTNCNLGTEYDFKIRDENFMKLFKLAQLGVDYLSYCEMYLDKCVVLLQEKLITSQNECELLRKEIHERKGANRNKSKSKALNYQCEKCAKVFISDVYLKFHERRRHSSVNTSDNFDRSPQMCSCTCQKIEDKKKLSISTQTLFLKEEKTVTQEKEDASNLKAKHLLKVEKLERELQELKERFLKAENKLSEKTEALKSTAFNSVNVPYSAHYNSMLMLLSSYLTFFGDGYCEINSGCEISVPEVCEPNGVLPKAGNLEALNSNHLREDMSKLKSEFKLSTEDKDPVLTEEKTESNIFEIVENSQKYQLERAEGLESEKENVDPKIQEQIFRNLTKPLPPPRKLKRVIREESNSKVCIALVKREANAEEKTEILSNNVIIRSTPVKEKRKEEIHSDIFEESIGNVIEINKPKANSAESLQNKKSVLLKSEPKSLIKKIVTRDSLSIQKLNENFKKSLNKLCDSSIEKEVAKRETTFQNLKAAVVDGLNNHLQQLGISSEWSGIPKKTLRQKLSSWKHQRKLLSKENPLYPVIRQNIEEKLFQKLNKNFARKKATSTNKLSKQESVNITGPKIQGILTDDKLKFVKSGNSFLYNTDTDSESQISDSVKKKYNSQKPIVVEEITSSEEKIEAENDKQFDKPLSVNKRDQLLTDSETDNSFSENLDQKSLKYFKKCPRNELIVGSDKIMETYENEKHHLMILPRYKGKEKGESQSTLKDGEGFQSKSVSNRQKKVLFASYSKSSEEELSDYPTDGDLWSMKSN